MTDVITEVSKHNRKTFVMNQSGKVSVLIAITFLVFSACIISVIFSSIKSIPVYVQGNFCMTCAVINTNPLFLNQK